MAGSSLKERRIHEEMEVPLAQMYRGVHGELVGLHTAETIIEAKIRKYLSNQFSPNFISILPLPFSLYGGNSSHTFLMTKYWWLSTPTPLLIIINFPHHASLWMMA
jgi:hypothetical protein